MYYVTCNDIINKQIKNVMCIFFVNVGNQNNILFICTGWESDSVGCIYSDQRADHRYAKHLGDGLCLCSLWEHGGCRVSIQIFYLLKYSVLF